MIEIATNTGSQEKVGTDPYYPTPLVDMDRQIVDGNNRISTLLEKLININERARETRAPEVIDLSANSGSQAARTYTTKTGIRVVGIVITSTPATDAFRITVGQRPYNFFGNGYWPFPIEITNGIDLVCADITTPGSLNFACYVIGYTY